jgi:oligopeptide transport system permease protein
MNSDLVESQDPNAALPSETQGAPAEGAPSSLFDSRPPLSPNQKAWRRFRRNRLAMVSSVFLVLIVGLVLIWPALTGERVHPVALKVLPQAMLHSPVALSDSQFLPPNADYWFGTDVHGRDLLARVFYGARISLLVGIVGAAVSLVIGVLWGAVAGYCGGRLDNSMMRVVDVLYSMPSIVFVIVLITTLEGLLKDWLSQTFSPEMGAYARMLFLFVGLGAVSWLTMARIVRGQVLSLRTRNFVDASRTLGASHGRIIARHILPNVLGIIIVYLTLTVPSIILYESFLSYLGLGIQAPQASLGSLIASGVEQINAIRIYWWLIVFPGGMLALTLLALNFLGDGLRDAWDPRGDISR